MIRRKGVTGLNMTMFASGRRLFSAASIATIVVAILHSIGHFSPPPANDAQYTVLERTMRDYRIPLGLGMAPSIHDIFESLSLTMSVSLLAFGILGLVLAADRDATPRLLSRTAAVFAGTMGLLTVLYLLYRIPPPFITIAIVTALYALAVPATRSG
jgi:hypothetical protein